MVTTKQLNDIEQLQQEVEAHDALELKLNWELLRARTSEPLDFFYYEKDTLLAFIGVYPFGSTVELTGMVKPSARRNGHFTKLFEQAMATIDQTTYKTILLNAPANAEAAKGFLAQQKAVYDFTEYQMRWEPQITLASSGFTLRPAKGPDFDSRVRLAVEAFDTTFEDAVAMESAVSGEPDTDILMIDVDNETVGKLRIQREAEQAWIYGFAILPEHQDKGIGRNVLQHIVKQQSEAGYSVHLDVEAKNTHALGLYKSVGFVVTHAQDYYKYGQ